MSEWDKYDDELVDATDDWSRFDNELVGTAVAAMDEPDSNASFAEGTATASLDDIFADTAATTVSGETYSGITPEERQRRIDSWNAGIDPDETGLWGAIGRLPRRLKEGMDVGAGSTLNLATGG